MAKALHEMGVNIRSAVYLPVRIDGEAFKGIVPEQTEKVRRFTGKQLSDKILHRKNALRWWSPWPTKL